MQVTIAFKCPTCNRRVKFVQSSTADKNTFFTVYKQQITYALYDNSVNFVPEKTDQE